MLIHNGIIHRIYRDIRNKQQIRSRYLSNKEKRGTEYAELCKRVETLEAKRNRQEQLKEAVCQKTKYIMSYIERSCSRVIDEYLKTESAIVAQDTAPVYSQMIWVFWWTGEKNAPDLVRACINSIRLNANGHSVMVLDQNNYSRFIQLPDYILRKHDRGIICHAHFADMLRLSLLAKYGGVWIDATVFLSQPLPEVVFKDLFYSFKAYDPNAVYPSKSRWCTYFLSGSCTFPMFRFVRDCLFEYWRINDYAIDYLLFDYVILIAYTGFPIIKKTIDSLPDNNPCRMELMAKISKPYSERLFRELLVSDTFASKLSWRYKNLTTTTKNGEETNYGHLLKLYLPSD